MKLSGENVLKYLIELLESYLQELSEPARDGANEHFIRGSKTAYVECLEIIQMWDNAERCGLNWNVESRYPLK